MDLSTPHPIPPLCVCISPARFPLGTSALLEQHSQIRTIFSSNFLSSLVSEFTPALTPQFIQSSTNTVANGDWTTHFVARDKQHQSAAMH